MSSPLKKPSLSPLNEDDPIGWIGLGNMGTPMVERLSEAGFPLFLYNRTPRSMNGNGPMTFCRTPADVARLSRLIFVMVTDGVASRDIFWGRGGLLEGDLSNRIVINMTTESPEDARREAEAVENAGGAYVDMPVSGSVVPAKRGELLLLAGGDSSLLPFVKPALDLLGSSIRWLGPVGSGMKAKLVLNALLAAHMRDLAETLLLARSLGLSESAMAGVILESPLATPFYRIKTRNILEEDFRKAFSVALMAKDLSLLSGEARREGILLPDLFLGLEHLYRSLADAGEGEQDLSVLYSALKKGRDTLSGNPSVD